MSLSKCLCCTHYQVHEGCTVVCHALGKVQMRSLCSSFEPDDYAQCYISSTNHCDHYRKTYTDGEIECNLKGRISYQNKCYEFVEDYGCIDKKKKGCFLTTASCQILGKKDNCDELESLRAFRDNYLEIKYPNLVNEYYNISPNLVDKLMKNKEKENISLILMNQYILKCISQINQNKYKKAIETYRDMVEFLNKTL